MTCPACGAAVPEGARFCPACGAPQAATPDERRLVTVLMADLVGFTSLAEDADPEAVKHLVDACFQRLVDDVRAHGGALDKIVGDQLVATFGAQRAHEDDAERAVRAALHMGDTVARFAAEIGTALALRIGVNTGEVLVGSLRAGGDATVMGDVVNTASRLQTVAAPGAVVVGDATHAATSAVIDYEPLGALPVRGRRDTVVAWRATGTNAPPGRRLRLKQETPLVGRESEMQMLAAVLEHTAERQTSHLVLLTGDAGVGKTRLLVELGKVAHHRHGVTVLGGHCVPYGESNPWAPVAEALRFDLGIDAVADLAAARDALRAGIARHPEAIAGEELDRLTDALLSVLGHDVRPDVDPTRAREEERRGIVVYLEALLHHGPVVLALSDMHWAHDDVLSFLGELVPRCRRRPLLVLVSARPEIAERWTEPPVGNLVALHVEPLDVDATRALALALLPDGVDGDVVDVLHERSGGNPLFLEELAALLDEMPDAGRADLDERLRTLPATLHGLVAARIDALTPVERSVVQDFAVVGPRGPAAAALSLSDAATDGDVVLRLEEAGLLAVEGTTFRFKSELIRDVAYQTLSRAERARRHAALADWFEAEGESALDETAHHAAESALLARDLVGADLPAASEARAVAALAAAAEAAERREHFRAATRHWDRLLQLASDDATRRRARLGCARAADGSHDLDAAQAGAEIVLAEAVEAGDAASEAAARMILGRVHQARNRYDDSDVELGRAITIFRELGDERSVAEALRQQGGNRLFSGELGEAERIFAEALGAFRTLGDLRGEAWALQNLAWISFTLTDIAVAEERLDQSIELFTRIGDWGGLSWALGLLAWVRFSRGRLWEAEELALSISKESGEPDNRWAQAMMGVLLANVALWTGRCATAVERAEAAERRFREIDDDWGRFQSLAPQVRALGKLARFDDYETTLARLRTIASRLPDPGAPDVAVTLAASVLTDRGDGAEALATVRGISQPAWRGLGNVERAAAEGLALLQSGKARDATERIRDEYAAATDDGPRMNFAGTLALSLAAEGRAGESRAVIAEVEALEGGTWSDRLRLSLARACLAARDGDAGAALAALTGARAIADATDATVDRAVVGIADAVVRSALHSDGAEAARRAAVAGLDEAGLTAAGWWTALRLAAGVGG